MAVNKRLAEKAAREQKLVLYKDVDEAKKKEIEEMEKHRDVMNHTLEEMEKKMETLEVEIEEERISLMDLNDQITGMILKIEMGGMSEEERAEEEQKKNKEEKKKVTRMEELNKKKGKVKVLYHKKEELMKERNLINEYLEKYYQELKDKKGVVEEEKGDTWEKRKREEKEEMKTKRTKPVSIFLKPYRTLLNTLEL